MKRRYQTSISGLQALRPVFTSAEIIRAFDWTPEYASVAIHRMKNRNIVKPLGARSEVYFNLIADTNWQQHWPEAVKLAMPSAVETGASVLFRAGWITQLPYLTTLAVSDGSVAHDIINAQVVRRPVRWYAATANGVDRTQYLPSMNPYWALADQLLDTRNAHLDPDDLYLVDAKIERSKSTFVDAINRLSASYGVDVSFDKSGTVMDIYCDIYEKIESQSAAMRR